MKLYFFPISANARRAVMTALTLNAPVELVPVDLFKGEQKLPDYLRKNPNGRVPLLEDGDFHLTESHAIMQYLCEKTSGQTLYPTGVQERADVNRWLFWCSHHFAGTIGALNFEHFVKGIRGLGAPDPAAVARNEALLHEHAKVLDAQLAGRAFVTQDRLTLADLSLATPLMAMQTAKLPLGDYANIAAWHERMRGLDAWKRTEPKR